MIAYIDEFRHRYGVEPICRVLPIAPSTDYHASRRCSSARAVRDAKLKVEIARVHAEHFGVARLNGKAVQLTLSQLALSCIASQPPAAHLRVGLEAITSNAGMVVAASFSAT